MELIDRDALIKFLRERQKSVHDRLTHPINWAEAYEEFIAIARSVEAVGNEVGTDLMSIGDQLICTNCMSQFGDDDYNWTHPTKFNFCPICGARIAERGGREIAYAADTPIRPEVSE